MDLSKNKGQILIETLVFSLLISFVLLFFKKVIDYAEYKNKQPSLLKKRERVFENAK